MQAATYMVHSVACNTVQATDITVQAANRVRPGQEKVPSMHLAELQALEA